MSYVSGSPAETKQLTEAFGLRGPAPVAIGREISPVIILGPNAEPPYHTKRGGHYQLFALGDAGFTGAVAIQNPADSGIIAVLRRIVASNQNAGAISAQVVGPFAAGQITITPGNTPIHWDSEPSGTGIVGIQRPTCRMGTATNIAAQLDPLIVFKLAANANFVVEGPWVLRPARGLLIQTLDLVARIDASFYWDEFPIL